MTKLDANVISEPSPLVSIVIPCWNGEAYLSEAIESAIGQSHNNIEIIVVDDGSSDGSLSIAQRFPQVAVISQKNSGVSVARNTGLKRSSGKFILFLDADDRLHPDAVRCHLKAFSRFTKAPMVYGSNRIIDEKGVVIGLNSQAPQAFSWRDVLLGVTPSPSQSMFRRPAILKAGAFNPNVKLGEDFDLYLRLSTISDVYCHGELVADYRKHPLQATKQPTSSLVSIIGVITSFKEYLGKSSWNDSIWDSARQHWMIYYGQYIPIEMIKAISGRNWRRLLYSSQEYVKHLPYTFIGSIKYVAQRAKQLIVG